MRSLGGGAFGNGFLAAKESKRTSPLAFLWLLLFVVVMQETAVPNLTLDWGQNQAHKRAVPRKTQNLKDNPDFTTEAISTSRFLIKLKTMKLFITLYSLNHL